MKDCRDRLNIWIAPLALMAVLSLRVHAEEEKPVQCIQAPHRPTRSPQYRTAERIVDTEVIQNLTLQCGMERPAETSNKLVSSSRSTDANHSEERNAASPAPSGGTTESHFYWMEALAKLLASIAWPVAAVLIAHFFKAELTELLARLRRLKVGGNEAEFSNKTEALVESEPEASNQAISAESIESAAIHPRGTILSEWLKVESAIQHLYYRKGLGSNFISATSSVVGLAEVREAPPGLAMQLVGG